MKITLSGAQFEVMTELLTELAWEKFDKLQDDELPNFFEQLELAGLSDLVKEMKEAQLTSKHNEEAKIEAEFEQLKTMFNPFNNKI